MRTLKNAVFLTLFLAAGAANAQTPPAVAVETTPPSAPPPPAPPPPPANVTSVGGAASSNDWKFDYHGYLRAPMRFGIGHNDNPAPGQSTTTIHYPVVPDDQYVSWQYTSTQSKDWSEAFFSYGNSLAKGTLGIQGFNFTDAAFAQASAQFGIGQGWITITPPLGYQNVRLEAKVGSHWGKYGMAGKYDAGKYDTYLFARTHLMGETVRMELDVGKFTLWGEEGFGAKQPDANQYNPAKFTLAVHGHAGLKWNRMLDISAHLLYSWAQQEDFQGQMNQAGETDTGQPDGKMLVAGADVALRNTLLGELYLGFAHVGCTHCQTVADAIETIHAYGGGEFALGIKGNYLDTQRNVGAGAGTGGANLKSNGTGNVETFLMQYDFSLANLFARMKGKDWWGDGPDLQLSYFMMFNAVSARAQDPANPMNPDATVAADADGMKRLKFGVDVLGTPLKWLGIGARIDRVQPNSYVPLQNFTTIAPRIVLKTAFVTHEEIMLQYSRYIYAARGTQCTGFMPLTTAAAPAYPVACVQPPPSANQPNGFGANSTTNGSTNGWRGAPTNVPDLNVIKLQGTMWW